MTPPPLVKQRTLFLTSYCINFTFTLTLAFVRICWESQRVDPDALSSERRQIPWKGKITFFPPLIFVPLQFSLTTVTIEVMEHLFNKWLFIFNPCQDCNIMCPPPWLSSDFLSWLQKIFPSLHFQCVGIKLQMDETVTLLVNLHPIIQHDY